MQIAATAVERHTFEDHPLRLDTLVERAAARSPHAIAAIYRDEQLSYRELNGRANQIARALRRHGVGAKCYVSLCAERSLSSITALVGIAKSGAAFVPLDPTAPDERLRTMIADTQPAILIIDDAARARFADAAFDTTVMTLTELFDEARAESGDRLLFDHSPRELAYVVYTSGSTGSPKGVMVEHRSVCNMLMSSIGDFALTHDDRIIQLAPLSFDPSIWQIFGTLAAGGCIVIPPAGTERDVDAIVREIRSHGVTVLITVPALLSLLIEREGLTESTALRIAVSGGAQLTPALRDRFRARRLPLYNVYGPTETAIHVTTHRCDDDDRDFVPIGTAIANTHVYVLDANQNPVQGGETGEIYIGGVGVARGYLNRSDLTAERFVRDPFAASPGSRLYRTGDLARLHADGSIEFIGRTDDQVKLRGVRIELEEIVAALERHPQVLTAAVAVDEERVHAYVMARERDGGLAASLRTHARTLLPAVAVPATFSVVDALPLLPNGKVDRAALPPPALSEPAGNEIPSFHPLADIVLSLWEELLGVRKIAMDDNFFDLGGDSLLAARLITQIEARVGRRVSLAVFFEDPTIAGMIAAIVDEERAAFESIITLRPSGSRTPFFYLHGDNKGMGLYARRFGTLLGDRPVYAIAPHGVGGVPVPPTIDAMAEDHVRAILAVDPNGPYAIGGWCLGGIVAFEVARQLERLGKRVVHVAMIETEESRTHLGRLIEKPLLRLASPFGIDDATKRALVGGLRSPARILRDIVQPKRRSTTSATEHRAVRLYVWEPLQAPATIFCSREQPNVKPEQIRLLWGDLFSSLEVEVVPGNHWSVIGRHVDALTIGLANALDRAGA